MYACSITFLTRIILNTFIIGFWAILKTLGVWFQEISRLAR